MTIILAYNDKLQGKYYIGSDSMSIAGDTMVDRGPKIITRKNYLIAYAASYVIGNIIEEDQNGLLPKNIKNLEDLAIFRDMIRDTAAQLNSDYNLELSNNDISLLIVSPYGIFTIEAQWQIHKIESNYIALGGGQDFALGALFAMKNLNINGGTQDMIHLAISAAIEHCASCGGQTHIKWISSKE